MKLRQSSSYLPQMMFQVGIERKFCNTCCSKKTFKRYLIQVEMKMSDEQSFQKAFVVPHRNSFHLIYEQTPP